MSITKEDAKKVAHLACLAISDEQLEHYTSDLVKVLDVVAKMESVDTHDITPMSHALDLDQRLRKDEVTESNERESLMSNAPATDAGVFLVPKVID